MSAKEFKMRLGAVQSPNPSENFPEFSGFFLTFPELILFIRRLKNIFMSSKYFIWIVRAPIYLWEFS
jgi:hypothetical protein